MFNVRLFNEKYINGKDDYIGFHHDDGFYIVDTSEEAYLFNLKDSIDRDLYESLVGSAEGIGDTVIREFLIDMPSMVNKLTFL